MYKNSANLLYANGYQPIPVAQGSKAPRSKSWQKQSGPESILKNSQLYPGDAVGINNINAIDVDILDPELSELMEAKIKEIDPTYLKRTGLAPKFLVPANPDSAIDRKFSATWYDLTGVKQVIEVLHKHQQQFVAYGVHPDTKKPYEWAHYSLLDRPAESLHLWTEQEFVDLMDTFNEACAERGFRQSQQTSSAVTTAYTISSLQRPDYIKADTSAGKDFAIQPKVSLEELTTYMQALPGTYVNDYSTWITGGAALHHETEGSTEGYELFDRWSQTGTSYKGRDETWFKWNSFKDIPGGATVGTIIFWLNESGTDVPAPGAPAPEAVAPVTQAPAGPVNTLPIALQRFMYLKGTNEVADFHTKEIVKFENAKKAMSQHDFARPRSRVKDSFMERWMGDPQVIIGYGLRFFPDANKPIITEGELNYFNIYKPPVFGTARASAEDLQFFLDHLKYIQPEQIVLDFNLRVWALKRRKPWLKTAAALFVTPVQQTGKTAIILMLRYMTGTEYVISVPAKELSSNATQFNEYLDGSIYNFCDEAKFDQSAYDTLKRYVFETRQSINKKNGLKGTVETFSSWIIFSNHLNTAVLDEGDQRLVVSIGRERRKDDAYYKKLFDLINDPSGALVNSFVEYLDNLDLAGFNHRMPPWSNAKAAMVKSSKNDAQMLIESLIADELGPCMFDVVSANIVHGYLKISADVTHSRKTTSAILEKLTAINNLDNYFVTVDPPGQGGDPLFNSKRQRGLICLRNYDKWKNAGNAALKLEFLRSREAAMNVGKTKAQIQEIQFTDLKEA